MGKKIFIKSIPRDTATKVHEFSNPLTGVRLNKTKIGNCKDGLMALYSRKIGGLNTGLTNVVETDEKGRQITLQEKMEAKWGKPAGYFGNSHTQNPDEEPTYFQNKVWYLNDGTTVLDLENMDDELFYYVCLASKYVANSEKEWRAHKWPKAMFYISLENESDELKHSRKEKRRKALAALEGENMTPTMKRKFAGILGLGSSLAAMTYEQVDNQLDEYIDTGAADPTGKTSVDKFMELYADLATDLGREKIEAKFLLQNLLDSRIVYEKQGTYRWVRKDMNIGDRYHEVIEFLLNPKKSADRDELEQELKSKTI